MQLGALFAARRRPRAVGAESVLDCRRTRLRYRQGASPTGPGLLWVELSESSHRVNDIPGRRVGTPPRAYFRFVPRVRLSITMYGPVIGVSTVCTGDSGQAHSVHGAHKHGGRR